MAVVVQCYHCDTILELDEGFRGGVCRCSTCGSLLQVPKAAGAGAAKARPAAPGANITDVKRPASPTADPGLSRGGFDPRNQSGGRPAVSDFGGSSSGLRQGRPSAPTATKIQRSKPIEGPAPASAHTKDIKRNNLLLWLALGLGLFIACIVVVLIVVFMTSGGSEKSRHGGDGKSATASGVPGTDNSAAVAAVKGPNFLGVPLVGKQIIISIDSASSMQETFDYVRNAAYQAIDTLDQDQTIMVVLWTGTTVRKVPASGFISKNNLKTLKDDFETLSARGTSDAVDCMKATLAVGGDQIIFITAKYDLPADLATTIFAARHGNQRIDAVKLTSEDNPPVMADLAAKTNGKFIFLTQSQLEQAVIH